MAVHACVNVHGRSACVHRDAALQRDWRALAAMRRRAAVDECIGPRRAAARLRSMNGALPIDADKPVCE
ncbi:hypothetical protein [Burkholderia alba]|uniref:hypothetical protein n=1 Tax=Burkholderia alba TaxID=2683677 RepID=UPI002B05FC7A|nr:hypothetical protein [Burkholderia alba]